MTTRRKAKQPRLLPTTAPIHENDTLTFNALTTRYKCRCGDNVETGIKLDAVTCIRCGSAMRSL